MTFRLRNIVPWGRSFDEYVSMFALTDDDLKSRILGCGDGPASFNSVLTRRHGHIVSCDPIYRFSAEEIRSRISDTVPTIARELAANADAFVWTDFDSVDSVIETRMSAMEEFLRDFAAGRHAGRYVDASLPELPFADDAFDLALCSHLLFLYSEHYDFAFHVDSIRALSRVASEVRIFPLLELGGMPSRHLQSVVDALDSSGLRTQIVAVDFEFQKGGNRMLVVT